MCILNILLILVIFFIIFKNNPNSEKFNSVKLRGTSNINGTPSKNTINVNLNNKFINPYDLSSKEQTNLNNVKALKYAKSDKQQKYLDNKIQAYNQILLSENNDVTYYYNTLNDNSKVTNNAYNIINSIDNVDYGKVKETGREKCKKNCKGTCVDGGFTGTSSCIPIVGTNFGTLYKNPEFVFGLNVPYYNVNNQEF
jgi:hypothetical protein